MANTFKNGTMAVTTTPTSIYTCPAATQAVIHAVYITNVDGINQADATIELYDGSKTTSFKIGMNLPIPVKSTLVLSNFLILPVPERLPPLDSNITA